MIGLYRAKRIDTGEFIEGTVLVKGDKYYIKSALPTDVTINIPGARFKATRIIVNNMEHEVYYDSLESINQLLSDTMPTCEITIEDDELLKAYGVI